MENKNNRPADDERKASIGASMGCVALIIIFMFVIAASLIIMYLRSILNGGKEFFIN